MKIGEKRSPVWDTFYQIPIEEDDLRRKKRARMIVEIGQEWIGNNTELILPKEVWFLVRELYRLLLVKEYGERGIGKCKYPINCPKQFDRCWDEHQRHTIFCRDDYKLWYYYFYKEKVDKKNGGCNLSTMKPLSQKLHPTKEVMKHINYGRVLYMFNKL